MDTKVKNIEKNVVELEFQVTSEEFEKGIEKAYIKNAKNFTVQGFRKGKAPRKLIEKMYGQGIFYEDAINFVLPDAYEKAVEESKIEPVDQPEIDIKQMYEAGKPLVVTAKVTVKPEVKIENYVGIKVPKFEYNVSDKEVETELEARRNRNARFVSITDRAIKDGDIVVIDFEGFVDDVAFEGGKGENHNLEIGSGQFIPGFEEQLVGANTGDEVTVSVTFPEEYHAPDLAGKDAKFNVKINEVKEKQLPDLDDDFAKDISEFDTLDQLKADIKEKLTKSAESRAKRETENAVLEKLCTLMEVDIPDAMIESQIDNLIKNFEMRISQQGITIDKYLEYSNMDLKALREQFKLQAEDQVKVTLALEAVASKENFEVTDEDLENEYKKIASQYGMDVDKIKEIIRPQDIDGMKKDIMLSKAVDFVVSSALIEEGKEKAKKEPAKKPAIKKTTTKKTATKKSTTEAEKKKPAED